MQTFWLGTHRPQWLSRLDVPLFLSRITLSERVSKYPRALAPWALDSGGFSEIAAHGKWTISPFQYVDEVRRFDREIGKLEWAAVQDWMCEPVMLQKTGLSIAEHQLRTTHSYETLQHIAPDMPWTPVLQGWGRDDYMRHLDLYDRRGHNLFNRPIVGIGSVCRRQSTVEAEQIIREISGLGIPLHGFGFKVLGLRRVADAIASADSMAWSFNARKNPPLPGCTHKNCANCEKYALLWREKLLAGLPKETAKPETVDKRRASA